MARYDNLFYMFLSQVSKIVFRDDVINYARYWSNTVVKSSGEFIVTGIQSGCSSTCLTPRGNEVICTKS